MASSQTTELDIDIDGAYGEGGGQILRNSLAFSALTGQSIHIKRIRANRPKGGGLRPQHLNSVLLLRDICCASTVGDEIGSSEIQFSPTIGYLRENDSIIPGTMTKKFLQGQFIADPGTAGSTTLLAQACIPVLICISHLLGQQLTSLNASTMSTNIENPLVKVILRGGTNQTMAPPFEYIAYVLLPILKHHLGINMNCILRRRGLVPVGHGELELRIPISPTPRPTKDWTFKLLQQGQIESLTAYIWSTNCSKSEHHMIHKICEEEMKFLCSSLGNNSSPIPFKILDSVPEVSESETSPNYVRGKRGKVFGILLLATTSTQCILASDQLTEYRDTSQHFRQHGKHRHGRKIQRNSDRGIAEHSDTASFAQLIKGIVQATTTNLCKELKNGYCTDSFLQDQLIIFMALAGKECAVLTCPLTDHTKSAIYVAEKMTDTKFFTLSLDQAKEKYSDVTFEGVANDAVILYSVPSSSL